MLFFVFFIKPPCNFVRVGRSREMALQSRGERLGIGMDGNHNFRKHYSQIKKGKSKIYVRCGFI